MKILSVIAKCHVSYTYVFFYNVITFMDFYEVFDSGSDRAMGEPSSSRNPLYSLTFPPTTAMSK